MKKTFLLGGLFLWAISLFSACDKNEDPKPNPTKPEQKGVYILNAGVFGGSNSTLDLYTYDANPEKKELKLNVFQQVNNIKLGDTGQSMLIYGSKIYIVVFGSNKIHVTDLNCKLIKTIELINEADQPHQPRHLTAYKGMIYASLFDGYVAQIDTLNFETKGKVKVGLNPEKLTVAKDKLFVCNSGGLNYEYNYDNTISVIDPTSFSVIDSIQVVLNPTDIVADEQNNLYVISMGNYKDIPNTLQRIDPVSYQVTTLGNTTRMALHKNYIYMIGVAYDEQFNESYTFQKYDIQQGKMSTGSFITDGTTLSRINSINVDPATGNIYIGTSDYINTGDMYVFSPEGKQLDKIALSGTDVKGAFFIPTK